MTSASEIEVRCANLGDAETISLLHLELCAEIYPGSTDQWIRSAEGAAYLAQRLAGEGLAVIATVRGQTAGYLLGGIRVSPDGVRAAGLESMYVTPNFRRKAVGMALVRRFLQWFGESGLRSASVAVQPENVAAHRLFQEAGFKDHELIEDGRTLILRIERSASEG